MVSVSSTCYNIRQPVLCPHSLFVCLFAHTVCTFLMFLKVNRDYWTKQNEQSGLCSGKAGSVFYSGGILVLKVWQMKFMIGKLVRFDVVVCKVWDVSSFWHVECRAFRHFNA